LFGERGEVSLLLLLLLLDSETGLTAAVFSLTPAMLMALQDMVERGTADSAPSN